MESNVREEHSHQEQMALISFLGKRFPLPKKDAIIIGRHDPLEGQKPDIDTQNIGGAEDGVSRRHAVIQRSNKGFSIEDLGSTNATFVNRHRLAPNEVRALKAGDEIRFGRMTFIFARY